MHIEQGCDEGCHRYLQGFFRDPLSVCSNINTVSAHVDNQNQTTQHSCAHRQSFLTFAEALSEALYLFQSRSCLPQGGTTVNHCLVFSLTEAHNMAIDWPYPLPPASPDQVSITQSSTCLNFTCSDFICYQKAKRARHQPSMRQPFLMSNRVFAACPMLQHCSILSMFVSSF